MPFKKTYLKSKPECKVTFKITAEQAGNAEQVKLIGEFNGWATDVSPMRRLKSGDFTQTINLPANNKYAFRYLINDTTWENDWQADEYTPNELTFDENSVVAV